jgi:hypothetical protein
LPWSATQPRSRLPLRRLARSRRRIGSMTLLLPLPEQRKVTVKSGKIISDRVIEANREVVAEL